MREGQTPLVLREQYAPSAYLIDTVDLTFDLDPAKTRVLNKMHLRRNPNVPPQALRLDGEELTVVRVLVNGAGGGVGSQAVVLAKQFGAARIVIEGHTDSSMKGRIPGEVVKELSSRRANAVRSRPYLSSVPRFPSGS